MVISHVKHLMIHNIVRHVHLVAHALTKPEGGEGSHNMLGCQHRRYILKISRVEYTVKSK